MKWYLMLSENQKKWTQRTRRKAFILMAVHNNPESRHNGDIVAFVGANLFVMDVRNVLFANKFAPTPGFKITPQGESWDTQCTKRKLAPNWR